MKLDEARAAVAAALPNTWHLHTIDEVEARATDRAQRFDVYFTWPGDHSIDIEGGLPDILEVLEGARKQFESRTP